MTQECILTARITRLAIFRFRNSAVAPAFTANVPDNPLSSAQCPATSLENLLHITAKAIPWSRAGFTNLDHPLPPSIRRGMADFSSAASA